MARRGTPLRVGLLGAGRIGQAHAARYATMRQARLVAVADARPEAADALARRYRARACHDYDALLEDGTIDMVDICLPTHLHEQAVVSAAGAGLPILCEKPIGRSLEEVDRMLRAVQRAGVMAMVAQVIRFWPEYVAIERMVRAGELGTPLVAAATRLDAMGNLAPWFKDPALSGGALLDLHIHDLDYLFSLFGLPRRVSAVGVQSETGGWDHVVSSLDFGATRAVAEASYRMPAGFGFTMGLRVVGARACVEYRRTGAAEKRAARSFVLHRPDAAPRSLRVPQEDAYLAEIGYFVDCVVRGRPPSIGTLADARAVLQVAMAVKESLETGATVSLAGGGNGSEA